MISNYDVIVAISDAPFTNTTIEFYVPPDRK